jgi:hypothetical protein
MADRKGDCYIDVWRDADFRGETLRIRGPAEYPTLALAEGRWGDDIGSLRVGPNAFVMAFRRRDFQDELVTFGPNDEVADLSQFKFDDDIESVRVIDSLKIFERVEYNTAAGHAAPEAAPDAAPEERGPAREPANPHKGRRRPGRKS